QVPEERMRPKRRMLVERLRLRAYPRSHRDPPTRVSKDYPPRIPYWADQCVNTPLARMGRWPHGLEMRLKCELAHGCGRCRMLTVYMGGTVCKGTGMGEPIARYVGQNAPGLLLCRALRGTELYPGGKPLRRSTALAHSCHSDTRGGVRRLIV